MTSDLEERLRRDLKNYSERARPDSIRPLREPASRRRSRAVRWLAPVAAGAAVVGVIIAVSIVSSPAARPPARTVAEPPGPMPPFYVTAWQTYAGSHNGQVIPTFATVHDSATGATLATVRVPTLTSPGGTPGPTITAAGDDRTFVIMEQSDSPNANRFYLLHVAANGRSAALTRLSISVPADLSVQDVALSPDGTRLALGYQRDCSARISACRSSGIRVVTMATGTARSWSTRANGAPFGVSWAGNDRLAFQWQYAGRTSPAGQQTGYRLLNLDGAGRDLLAARPIASPGAEPNYYVPQALVTADGAVVITSTVQNIPDGHGRYTVVAKVIELSADTGQLLRVLYTVTVRHASGGGGGTAGSLDQGCNVLSLSPAGEHVLVACFAFGRVDGHGFRPLPGFPGPSSSGISGQQAAAW